MSSTLTDKVTAAFPFLRNNMQLCAELLESALLRTFATGTPLYAEGEMCGQIAFVLAGEIRVYKTNDSGREITLYELVAGDTCILTASCLLAQIRYPANAVTLERTEALIVQAADFRRLMNLYPDLRSFVATMLGYRLAAMMTLIEEIVFNRMDRRLFEYLIERSANNVVNRTHQKIANDLGTSREVVSRLLKDFQSRGAIQSGRNQITILEYQPVFLKQT